MTILIDNYDSFTYNLVQAIAGLGIDVKVFRNDKIDVDGIAALKPDSLVISPGPGNPDSAGVSLAAVKAFAGKIPILGVCLGHQTIAQAFGGRIVHAKSLMHGKTSRIRHDGKGIFIGLPQGFEAMRYHSLAVERATLPDCFEISAETDDGEIMALRHKTLPIESVQYHPESIGTPEGIGQLRNFFGIEARRESSEETVSYHEFRGILRGDYSERELAALLTDSREKPVTTARLVGAARAMREAMGKIDLGCDDAVDLVGTGGDGRHTINISTTAAFVAAGAGVKIAKHGNVAATSKCGAADVLRELGVDLTLKPDGVRACFDETGIAFLFAQRYHPGMRFAANVRRQLGFKTLFNLLGPITNPAGVTRQAIGVYDPKLVPTVAEALKELGSVHALVFSGTEGMDEIAPTGFTILSELNDGKISTGLFSADSVLPKAERDLADLAGGDAAENAAILRGILSGEIGGVRRDAVLVNAAAAIVAGGKASTMEEGYKLACESIDSGRASEKLKEFVKCTSKMH
ncbi:MAG: anthranilate phosphoribosyltransferase [Kiritimatiellae bacterium]|nr:anthranilate phosphoribosyltransferase [Kiritimatiellia bacterium]